MTRLEREYFERIYADSDDPWGFESAWYEKRKQALTMALLTRPHYESVFEPGCASGELTRHLSARAGHVYALEILPRIVARAITRLADLTNVEVQQGAIPDDWPRLSFNLIVLSEVVYYLDPAAIAVVARLIEETLAPGGDLVLVHYLGETDYPVSGREAHELLCARLGWPAKASYTESNFEAMVLQR